MKQYLIKMSFALWLFLVLNNTTSLAVGVTQMFEVTITTDSPLDVYGSLRWAVDQAIKAANRDQDDAIVFFNIPMADTTDITCKVNADINISGVTQGSITFQSGNILSNQGITFIGNSSIIITGSKNITFKGHSPDKAHPFYISTDDVPRYNEINYLLKFLNFRASSKGEALFEITNGENIAIESCTFSNNSNDISCINGKNISVYNNIFNYNKTNILNDIAFATSGVSYKSDINGGFEKSCVVAYNKFTFSNLPAKQGIVMDAVKNVAATYKFVISANTLNLNKFTGLDAIVVSNKDITVADNFSLLLINNTIFCPTGGLSLTNPFKTWTVAGNSFYCDLEAIKLTSTGSIPNTYGIDFVASDNVLGFTPVNTSNYFYGNSTGNVYVPGPINNQAYSFLGTGSFGAGVNIIGLKNITTDELIPKMSLNGGPYIVRQNKIVSNGVLNSSLVVAPSVPVVVFNSIALTSLYRTNDIRSITFNYTVTGLNPNNGTFVVDFYRSWVSATTLPVLGNIQDYMGSDIVSGSGTYSKKIDFYSNQDFNSTDLVAATITSRGDGIGGISLGTSNVSYYTMATCPVIDFVAPSKNLCFNTPISFVNSSAGDLSNVLFNWDFGDNTAISHETNPMHTFVLPGAYTVTLTLNANSCTTTPVFSLSKTINIANCCGNLVANSDFELGYNSFTSNYLQTMACDYPNNSSVQCFAEEQRFAITKDGTRVGPHYYGKDHTTGDGKFLMVNGKNCGYCPGTTNYLYYMSGNGSPDFYGITGQEKVNFLAGPGYHNLAPLYSDACTQKENMSLVYKSDLPIAVLPNTNYEFSAWCRSVVKDDIECTRANLAFYIFEDANSPTMSQLGTAIATDSWVQFKGVWNSGNHTSVRLGISDVNGAWYGNDFGIDDISFKADRCLPISEPPICKNCIGTFSPATGRYVVSAWVKEGAVPITTNYQAAALVISFTGSTITKSFTASGNIIDGWQRIDGEFTVPAEATEISVHLNNSSTATAAYFDDIRIHPVDGSMKSYVYDPISLKLVAELDENNYATMYEYDDEGKLVRVKKETEKGISTIKETREGNVKR
jgi:PKD repeat protein